jgi:TetR/AcrR family transcriptional regulator, transcriptional repressor for nem operon
MPRPREFDEGEVVESAMHVFWEHGYASSGMRELSTATGLLPGSIHQAFGSKRGLFLETLDRYTGQAIGAIRGLLATHESVLEGIRASLAYVASDDAPQHRAHGCLVANTAAELAPSDPEITERVRVMFRLMEEAFAEALLRGQALGEIRSDRNVTATARFLVSSIEGLRIYGKAAHPTTALTEIVDTIVAACT